jgi:TonB-dependent receptor
VANVANVSVLVEGFEMQHKDGAETRNGYLLALEWASTDNFTLKADAFYSKFNSEQFARGFRVKLEAPQVAINNPVIVDNILTGGNFGRTSTGNTRVELVNDDNQEFDEILNLGLGGEWQITDNWSMAFDISNSSSESDFCNGLLWSLVAEDATIENPQLDENVSISYKLNGLDLPNLGFSQQDAFSNINRVMVSKYGIYPFQNTDDLDAYRVDFQYEIQDNDYVRSIEFGVRHSSRTYTSDRSVFEYGSDSNFSLTQPPLRIVDDFSEVVEWQGDFGYFPSFLSIDLENALNAWFPNGVPQPQQTFFTGASHVLNPPGGLAVGLDTSWSVEQSGEVYETVTAAYVMANLSMEIGDMPVTGNIGVRMVDSKQASTFLQP